MPQNQHYFLKAAFFFLLGAILTSCTALDKYSKDAATFDNDLNKGSRRLIRDMKHDEG
ncbi:MAG: hypothetical protein ACOYK6_00490 [Chthoniobacterales bacterium]